MYDTYLGIGGVTVVGERGGGRRQLTDATGSFEPGRAARVEQHVVVARRHRDRVDVRHERGRQDPDGRRRTVGRLDLLHGRLAQIRSHEHRHEAVLRHHHVSTSTATHSGHFKLFDIPQSLNITYAAGAVA